MSKKRRKKKRTAASDPVGDMLEQLQLDPARWDVHITFTKGALTATRGAVVTVTNLKTGKKKRVSRPARTKNEVRQVAASLLAELVQELK